MVKYTLTLLLLAASVTGYACITCNRQIQEGIWNSQFYPNLLTMLSMLSAFIVLAVIVVLLSRISAKRHIVRLSANPNIQNHSPVPLTKASMVLGIGLGGFIDGIVLHQVLQWHEMLSAKIPATDYVGKSINMFWDGIFHFFCLLVVLVGIVLLWKLIGRIDIDKSGRLLVAGLLLGWGFFNIVEGVIDHHLLKLHNVFELSRNHNIGNLGFLGLSVVMLVVGYGLVKSHNKRSI